MTFKGILRLILFVTILMAHGTASQRALRVHIGEARPGGYIDRDSWATLSFPLFHIIPPRYQNGRYQELMFLNSSLWGLVTVLLTTLIRLPDRGTRLTKVVASIPAGRGSEANVRRRPGPGDDVIRMPPRRSAAAEVEQPPTPQAPGARVPVAAAGAQTFGKGRYEVLGTLGTGGFGSVLRVRDRTRGLDVALKTFDIKNIPREDRDDYRTLFQQEAIVAGRLDHHGIVPVFDHDATGDKPYIVMSLIKGGTLRERLDQSTNRRLAWPQVRDIGVQVAEALEYGRSHGVKAHRDIKPANIFTTDAGYKVGDFGIARPLRAVAKDTSSPFLAGTPSYMAPEQALYPDSVDWRADQFSLCVVLYEALTGQRPYRTVRVDMEPGDDIAPLQRMLEAVYSELRPVRDLAPETHPAIAQAIERGLRFDRTKRYASWTEFIAALRSAGTRAVTSGPAAT